MFSGPIVWRGVVYTILMAAGKLLCGVWLLSFASPIHALQLVVKKVSGASNNWKSKKLVPAAQCITGQPTSESSPNGETRQQPQQQEIPVRLQETRPDVLVSKNVSPEPEMPVSVYPACILGFAMVARGEIGFLISALAESTGIFSGSSGSPNQPSELFLIVTWSISLCTIIGPVCVGLLVNRVRRLEMRSGKLVADGFQRNVLGSWGVS